MCSFVPKHGFKLCWKAHGQTDMHLETDCCDKERGSGWNDSWMRECRGSQQHKVTRTFSEVSSPPQAMLFVDFKRQQVDNLEIIISLHIWLFLSFSECTAGLLLKIIKERKTFWCALRNIDSSAVLRDGK